LNNLTWTATRTTWSIIGDGAAGWSTDVQMTYDAVNKVWKVTTNLTNGAEIKFRANNDWAVNFGDDGANGSLEYGGANIKVNVSIRITYGYIEPQCTGILYLPDTIKNFFKNRLSCSLK
jgi:hypothetical protein